MNPSPRRDHPGLLALDALWPLLALGPLEGVVVQPITCGGLEGSFGPPTLELSGGSVDRASTPRYMSWFTLEPATRQLYLAHSLNLELA